MSHYTFSRAERLKSRKIIAELFRRGQTFGQYPLRLFWLPLPQDRMDAPVQAAFSVPRRKFKRAVDRNRIKRQMREAYRLQKPALYRRLEGHPDACALMLLYVGKEKLPYADIQRAMRKAIRRLSEKLSREQPSPSKKSL